MADRSETEAIEAGANHTLYEIARWRLEEQIGRVDSLDRKLAATFSLNGALIALLAAAFAFAGDEATEAVWWLLLVVVAIFVLNIFCTYSAYRLRRWLILPQLSRLQEVTEEYEESATRLWVALEMKRAYEENETSLRKKADWLRLATALTMVDLVLAAVAAVVSSAPW